MRISKGMFISLFVSAVMVVITACGGSSDPSGPETMNVAGTWVLSGTVAANDCAFMADEPGLQVGAVCGETLIVSQDGENLTAVDGTGQFLFSGIVSDKSFALSQTNAQSQDIGGGCLVLMTADMAVATTTETSGTGSANVNVTASGNCGGFTACSTSCSGTWTKTAGAKYAGETDALLPLIQESVQ